MNDQLQELVRARDEAMKHNKEALRKKDTTRAAYFKGVADTWSQIIDAVQFHGMDDAPEGGE